MVDTATRPQAPQAPGAPGPSDMMDPREQRAALLRLAIVVIAGLVVAAYFGALATVLVVLGLILMIVLHEFGHFVAAKRAGMKVTEFFVGFGPRLWSVTKGETTYGVKALPLGGYCRIIGMTNVEEVDPADEPRAYRNQPTWRRADRCFSGLFRTFPDRFCPSGNPVRRPRRHRQFRRQPAGQQPDSGRRQLYQRTEPGPASRVAPRRPNSRRRRPSFRRLGRIDRLPAGAPGPEGDADHRAKWAHFRYFCRARRRVEGDRQG